MNKNKPNKNRPPVARTTMIQFGYDNKKQLLTDLLNAFNSKKLVKVFFTPDEEKELRNSGNTYKNAHLKIKKIRKDSLYEFINNLDDNCCYYFLLIEKDEYVENGCEITIDDLNYNGEYYALFNLLLKHILNNYYNEDSRNKDYAKIFSDSSNLRFIFHFKPNKKYNKYKVGAYRLDLNASLNEMFLNLNLGTEFYWWVTEDTEKAQLGMYDRADDLYVWNESIKKIKQLKRLDARTVSKGDQPYFINFSNQEDKRCYLPKTKMWVFNKIKNILVDFFNKNNIKLKPSSFVTDTTFNIELNEELNLDRDVLVINGADPQLDDDIKETLETHFGRKGVKCNFYNNGDFVSTVTGADYDILNSVSDKNILFLTLNDDAEKINENIAHQDLFNMISSGENLEVGDEIDDISLDLYTVFKYNNLFILNNTPKAYQNVLKQPKGQNGVYTFDLGSVEKASDSLKKIIKELTIKEFIAMRKKLDLKTEFDLDGEFRCLYVYNKMFKRKCQCNKVFYMDVVIKNNQLKIVDFNELALSKIEEYRKILPKRENKKQETIYNDGTFVLIDKKTGENINYQKNSRFTPQIIGNEKQDFIKMTSDLDFKLNREAHDPDEILLPYTVALTNDKRVVHIQHLDNGRLNFFVPPSILGTKEGLKKMDRVYFSECRYKNGEFIVEPENTKVFSLFFNMFTSQIINSSNGKTNLLEKFIKTLIFN